MSRATSKLISVLMMKYPVPGAVKTRLVRDGYSEETAAAIAREMGRCIAQRLRAWGPLVLGVSPDGCGGDLAKVLDVIGVSTVDQGQGDLGERLARLWRTVASESPVAFFGIDSPDLPVGHLQAIADGLRDHDLAVGPTEDGGYWTLAARRYLPQVIAGIDWGGPSVYDATLQRAREAGLRLCELEPWPDVDFGKDVESLKRRLDDAGADLDTPLARLRLQSSSWQPL